MSTEPLGQWPASASSGAGRSLVAASIVICQLMLAMSQCRAAGAQGEGAIGGRIRGLVTAHNSATISAAQPGTIKAIGPNSGEAFRKGDPLVVFDCGIFDAELTRALAVAEAAADAKSVKSTLAIAGSVSRLQAMLAEAELKKALAEVVVAQSKVAQCVIAAPWNGRVVRRVANAHETVGLRDPLLEIVDDGAVELRAYVPSQWLAYLETGSVLTIDIDETRSRIRARISAMGAAIDNVSQLIEIRAEILTPDPRLLPGMSGRVEFAK